MDTIEDPHTVLHLYEGDGGVIIRENGNVSTFGVQSDAVTAAFYAASDDTDETTTRDLLATIAGLRQQLERVTQERDEATAQVERLATFFREERPSEGFEGDVEGRSPIDSAIHVMRRDYTRAERAEAENARLVVERNHYRSGLQMLASTFYKEDQHQDYARHILNSVESAVSRAARQATEEKTDG